MTRINPKEFVETLTQNDITFASGVPCSGIKDVFFELESNPAIRYINTPSETVSIGLNAGAWLCGNLSASFCQNSGLGHMVNPLVSLSEPYGIPSLLFVSMRGHPSISDEPQHRIMGTKAADILKLIEVNHLGELSGNLDDLKRNFSTVHEGMTSRLSQAFTIPPKMFETVNFSPMPKTDHEVRPEAELVTSMSGAEISRRQAVDLFYAHYPDDVTVATMGYAARELAAAAGGEKDNHFLMTGSLGLASSIGLGVALNSKERVFVLDGDGGLLMHMGNMALIGQQSPKNLVHILLDNEQYGSTGGQSTRSNQIEFARCALSCGYKHAIRCEGQEGIEAGLSEVDNLEGPIFVHCKVTANDEREGAPRAPKDYRAHASTFRNYMMSLK